MMQTWKALTSAVCLSAASPAFQAQILLLESKTSLKKNNRPVSEY